MPSNRRDFLKLMSLFSLATSLPLLQACSERFAFNPNAPLRIGYLPITDATPLLVAIDQKMFEKRDIAVEKPVLFRSWAQLVEAFISGQVNAIHLLSPMAVWLRYGSTAPAKVIMWNHMAGSALTVAPDIDQITDLSGQTLAIPFWYSIHNVVLQHILKTHQLSITHQTPQPNEVRLVVMAPSDMVAALATRKIAGFIVAEPFNAIAEQKGLGKILRFSADVWKDHSCCLTLMHDHDIEQRPEWVGSITEALMEAQLWANTHRVQTAHLLSKQGTHQFMPHDVSILEQVLNPAPTDWQRYIDKKIIRHPDWQQNRIAFQPYPYRSYTETLITLLQNTHIAGVNRFLYDLDPVTVADDLVDDRFIKAALIKHQAFDAFNLPEHLTRQELIIV
ncbi:ABC transporter substrate-binding protein [Wohlfahrtiimonas chitiniclastica]|uniref:ABC transporter substrate-binding protein n=1 Tax=Wohlfahrtiimonas chitiniclastica TaxID=400946 RepID=UPI000B982784|nr:ABC transporter substrate-binding protein [Wohlfahrtiimonas chitiniclastica]OYQ79916.1 ABC transporter substrate-binding protein [Wohlfahrtiimonas chitiniclastica]